MILSKVPLGRWVSDANQSGKATDCEGKFWEYSVECLDFESVQRNAQTTPRLTPSLYPLLSPPLLIGIEHTQTLSGVTIVFSQSFGQDRRSTASQAWEVSLLCEDQTYRALRIESLGE